MAPGESNLVNRIRSLAQETGLSADTLRDLTVSAVLAKLAQAAGDDRLKKRISALGDITEKVGLGHMTLDRLL